MYHTTITLLICLFLVALRAIAHEITEPIPPDQVARILAATGRLEFDRPFCNGAGVVFDNKGHILTAEHVWVADAQGVNSLKWWTYTRKEPLVCEMKYAIRNSDLAVLQVDSLKGSSFVPLGDFDALAPYDHIAYVGWDSLWNPKLEYGHVVSKGVMIMDHYGDVAEFLEFRAEFKDVIPGYSGSPVFNLKGEIVAIISYVWNTYFPVEKDSFTTVRAISVDSVRVLHQGNR